ncbi:YceD family protein [Sphingomonas sp.]|uniref:YceD family protein n=1 Tax=Sphingomonas sp. TaxID=28214 RepID=UPI002DD6A70B|nr:YceD family protein [Sphingomonas sp.]
MTGAVEFSRPRRLDTIGEGAVAVAIAADEGERMALAARFGLTALDRLTADYTLRRDATGIIASGTLSAAVVQPCIATGDPVPATIDEPFDIRFLPEAADDALADEVELDGGDLDTMFYSGSAIDLGEAAAETLALALDPYPRSSRAEAALREAGVQTEDATKPAGAFAGLKDMLGGKDRADR